MPHAGESGLVYKAYIETAVGKELVAVKTGKGVMVNIFTSNMFYSIVLTSALFSTNDLEKMAKEISAMLLFKHPNVMSLIGVCLDGEMPLIIMPFMSNGSILEFVRNRKEELFLCSRDNLELVCMYVHVCVNTVYRKSIYICISILTHGEQIQ